MNELKELEENTVTEPDDETSEAAGEIERLIESAADEPDEPEVARSGFRLRRHHLILTALLALLGTIGGFALLHFRQIHAADADDAKAAAESAAKTAQPSDLIAPDPAQLSQISVEPVGEQAVTESRNTTGRVSFNEDRETPVFTPYAGRIVEVLANKGDNVKAGQPLLIIESPEIVAAQNDLSAAHSDADKAAIAVDAAQKAAERARRLHEREAISTRELQQAETDLARTREEQRRAQAAVAVAENRLALFGKSADEIRRASGQSSELRNVDRRITIRAPIAGTIVDRRIGPGQYVKPDAPDPMFLIADLSTLWVLADVYESDLAGVKVGAPVEISIEAYPNRTFPARISFINPTVDPATRTIRVRCLVNNQSHLLKPDMFARISIGAVAQRQMPVVPASAVVSEGSEAFVFVETAPGRFRKRQVKVGTERKEQVVIAAGVQPGEHVVTKGALLLKS
ncbi:MAG TPA: efflux RND transporter periplasmic adaptor subunit [Blastocatellia bacterium]|nr:efflux RND transporter periplasmic adaptor subunit [Blastocatellia bacterium]